MKNHTTPSTKAQLLEELQTAKSQIIQLENIIRLKNEVNFENDNKIESDRLKEDRFRLLFQTMSLGVLYQNAEGVVVDANPAAETILGLTLDQLRGRTSLNPCWRAIHEDRSDFSGETHPAMIALETGQPVMNVVMGVHNPASDSYRWIKINAVPHFRSGEEKPYMVHITFEDFTERKQVEDALKVSEENYRSLVENSESAIGVVDRDGRLLYANAWTLRIWNDPHVVGKSIFDLFPTEYASRYSAATKQVIDSQISILDDIESTINGRLMWFRISMSPLKNSDGTVDKLLVNAWDVTEQKLAEDALRKSEQILREAQSIADLGSWTADLRAGTFDASPEGERMLGLTPRLHTAEEFIALVHPEDRDYMQSSWESAMRGAPYDIEHRVIVDGEVKWLYVKATVSFDQAGQPVSVIGITQDITKRKQGEQEIHLINERLTQLTNNISDIFWIAEAGTGSNLFISQAFESIAGMSYERASQLPDGFASLVVPEDRNIFFEGRRQQAQGMNMEVQYRICRPDGSIRWIRDKGSPVLDQDGKAIRLVGVARDVTERVETELRLREAETRFLQIAQNIQEVFWMFDNQQQKLIYISSAYEMIWGRTVESLYQNDRQYIEAIHPNDREIMFAALERQSRGEKTEMEYRIVQPDGSIRWILDHSFPVFDEDGQLIRTTGTAADITERKQTEQALVFNEKRLRTLVDSQTHYVLRTDLEGKYTYWNSKYEEEFGWLHRHQTLMSANALDSICEHHHPRVQEVVVKCITQPGQVFKVELDKPAKDGSIRTTLWEFICLTDENNVPSEVQCMGIEITDRKKAEDALRTSEEKYRGLMESMDSVIAGIDYDGCFIYMNDVCARQFGGTPQELIGKTMHDLFPESIASEQLEIVRKVIREDRSDITASESFVHGNPRWFRTAVQPIHDESGRVVYALINANDIHDLKTAQNKLLEWSRTLEERVRERTAEVQDLYENAPTGYHSLDKEGNFVMINETELQWLGYAREEIIGHSLKEFITERSLQIFQSNFSVFMQSGSLKDLELEFIRKQGTILPVLLSATAIYDPDGNFVMSRSTLFDNTERKRAEEALRESEERYRKAISAADAVPYSLDYASNAYSFIGQNIENLSGYSREEMTPALFDSIILQTSMQGDLSSLATQDATHRVRLGDSDAVQAVWRSDFLIKHKYGEKRWLSDISVQVLDANGKVTGSIGILQNITERKKAEEALRLANVEMERALRMKDEFLTSMSHELRTPLTGILGLSEALQYNTYGELNQKQKTALANIDGSGRHLLDLINDILDISKMEAGKLDLQMEPCSLNEICQSALQLIKGMAHKKNQNVSFSMNPTTIMVLGEARRLKQIVVNLLSNAVKYSPENSAIGLEVIADQETETVKIAIWDHGIGIATEDLEKLFQPFVQLDSSLSRQQTGTGLGLALVQRLVDLHGGSIQVESTPGQGSRFTVTLSTLPFSPVPQTSKHTLPAQLHQALIIEDSGLDANRLNKYLTLLDISSITHSRGIGAVERAIEIQPDVIFLDLLLPDLSGWDVLESLRINEKTSKIPIVVTSVEEDRERASRLGAAGYLVKLFTQSDLYNAIARLQRTAGTPALQESSNTLPLETFLGTVMLVDDNEINTMMVEDFLRSKRFQVVTARNGLDFLSRVEENQPDIVLMDIQMPGIDGLETTRRLRSHPDARLASVPVIAITALAMPGDRERCLEAGASEYLSKPLRLEELRTNIQKYIKKDVEPNE